MSKWQKVIKPSPVVAIQPPMNSLSEPVSSELQTKTEAPQQQEIDKQSVQALVVSETVPSPEIETVKHNNSEPVKPELTQVTEPVAQKSPEIPENKSKWSKIKPQSNISADSPQNIPQQQQPTAEKEAHSTEKPSPTEVQNKWQKIKAQTTPDVQKEVQPENTTNENINKWQKVKPEKAPVIIKKKELRTFSRNDSEQINEIVQNEKIENGRKIKFGGAVLGVLAVLQGVRMVMQ
ncbi:Hypothetical_protein [Hexamita inflata]|uniref:Hypothetical_protein n=1 Tax=Hexamita inflata TaxID=28002 RepID=A0AA86V4Y4_9EUKA|nr:Hypothetical protein HINF_LOCUS64142 [Hexamita inflata]